MKKRRGGGAWNIFHGPAGKCVVVDAIFIAGDFPKLPITMSAVMGAHIGNWSYHTNPEVGFFGTNLIAISIAFATPRAL